MALRLDDEGPPNGEGAVVVRCTLGLRLGGDSPVHLLLKLSIGVVDNSAVAGVIDATVDGESLSFVTMVKDGRVIKGGSIDDGASTGGAFEGCLLGLLPGDGRCFERTFRD